jgi:hypothetical protein
MKTKTKHCLRVHLLALLGATTAAHAEETLNHWLSVGSVNVAGSVEPGSERVDPLSGMLTATRRDVHLPGPAGLDIDVVRVYRSFPNGMGTNQQVQVVTGCNGPSTNGYCAIIYGSQTDPTPGPTNGKYVNGNVGTDSIRTFMPLGFGWQMHIGRVYREGQNDNASAVCGPNSGWKYDPNNTGSQSTNLPETELHQLPILELQDGSRRVMYLAQKSSDSLATYLSSDLWQLKCGTTPYLLSPTGLRLDLGFASTETDTAVFTGQALLISSSQLWVTKITDRFGNSISITYDSPTQTIRQVTGSDGRSIQFNYVNTTNSQNEVRLNTVVVNGRTYAYNYSPISTGYSPLTATANANFYLHYVSLPEGLTETYSYYIHRLFAPTTPPGHSQRQPGSVHITVSRSHLDHLTGARSAREIPDYSQAKALNYLFKGDIEPAVSTRCRHARTT